MRSRRKGRLNPLQWLNPLRWLGWLFAPIQRNGAFFVFMFALGYLCCQLEVMPVHLPTAEPYPLAVPELFLDLYIVCAILALLPQKVRFLARLLLYVVFYGVAVADVFCYERFESTLTPTMLMLVGETDGREAGEFFSSYVGWDVLSTQVRWVLLLLLLHVAWTLLRALLRKVGRRIILPKVNAVVPQVAKALLGMAAAGMLYWAFGQCRDNKEAMRRLFSYDTVGQVERELTRKDQASLYVPVYRLAFSVYANQLASSQIDQLLEASGQIRIDSCCYRVPDIVLIIGESYNKHHSQLYGYPMPTTPRQLDMAREGSLVAYTDVVAPWNLTSYVFKNILSLHAVGDSGEWCDYPLFPEVFRKAGYHVTFITNQFQSQAAEAVYDFSGGFFLNHPELSRRQFDTRNTSLHRYDEGVLDDFDRLTTDSSGHNLTILHLMGSHLMYKSRYPQATRKHLKADMYDRPELSYKQRLILADYDNSVLYNDSIVWAVTQKMADKDAVVIYMPDHAEEIFDHEPYVYGRRHAAEIDYWLARGEFEIPFWVWGSPKYRENHPYGWLAIQGARNRRLMTDVLPHLLLYLGGISTSAYRPDYNVILPEYNQQRPRLLKGTTDYDALRRPAPRGGNNNHRHED